MNWINLAQNRDMQRLLVSTKKKNGFRKSRNSWTIWGTVKFQEWPLNLLRINAKTECRGRGCSNPGSYSGHDGSDFGPERSAIPTRSFLSSFKQILGKNLNYDKHVSFCICLNSLFTKHPLIRHYKCIRKTKILICTVTAEHWLAQFPHAPNACTTTISTDPSTHGLLMYCSYDA